MSLVEQAADQPATISGGVLIVSDAADQEIRGFRTAIAHAGVPLESVPDVYAATARLARRDWTGKIFVDVRTLDDKEMAFLRLVPRFFPKCEVVVPAFAGTGDRPALQTSGCLLTAVVDAIAFAVAGRGQPYLPIDRGVAEPEIVAAAIPEPIAPTQPPEPTLAEEPAPAAETEGAPLADDEPPPGEDMPSTGASILAPPADTAPEPPPVLRLSTDGGPEAADAGPALHEVVRMRMSAEERRPIRRAPPRTPPGARAPQTPPVTPPADSAGGALGALEPLLSPDEMDALLRDDDAASNETPPTDEEHGEVK